MYAIIMMRGLMRCRQLGYEAAAGPPWSIFHTSLAQRAHQVNYLICANRIIACLTRRLVAHISLWLYCSLHTLCAPTVVSGAACAFSTLATNISSTFIPLFSCPLSAITVVVVLAVSCNCRRPLPGPLPIFSPHPCPRAYTCPLVSR
jgi:hypothetical protein